MHNMNRFRQSETEERPKYEGINKLFAGLSNGARHERIGLIVIEPQNEIYPEIFYYVCSPETVDLKKTVEIAPVKNEQ